ncbi:MAG: hypothetical protein EOO77_19025 [Oxalobacteraceae bacterium]|nr:MAG: hypothetical protein EOO77_19025 [Oxalobacteraceae bacterium]
MQQLNGRGMPVWVVTRNSSSYSDHDFSTMAVETDSFSSAVKRVEAEVLTEDMPDMYLRGQRFDAYRHISWRGGTVISWEDHWTRYTALSKYTVEQWEPGAERPERSWRLDLDKCMKERIVREDWDDGATRQYWRELRREGLAAFMRDVDAAPLGVVACLTKEDRKEWTKRFGFQGRCEDDDGSESE